MPMKRQGLAIVNMLIYVVIFSILSGVVLATLSSSTRELEKNIRRTKALHLSQAAIVFAIDQLRLANTCPASAFVDWNYDLAGNSQGAKQITLTSTAGAGPSGTMQIDAATNYTFNW